MLEVLSLKFLSEMKIGNPKSRCATHSGSGHTAKCSLLIHLLSAASKLLPTLAYCISEVLTLASTQSMELHYVCSPSAAYIPKLHAFVVTVILHSIINISYSYHTHLLPSDWLLPLSCIVENVQQIISFACETVSISHEIQFTEECGEPNPLTLAYIAMHFLPSDNSLSIALP